MRNIYCDRFLDLTNSSPDVRPSEVTSLSLVSKRFSVLTRDNGHWRKRCYNDSRVAARERREEFMSQQSSGIAALTRAVNELSHGASVFNDQSNPDVALPHPFSASRERRANWDPSYPGEMSNFYQEYVHRHAPIHLSWFERMSGRGVEDHEIKEATGAGVFYDASGLATRLYAPLNDGSIAVWNTSLLDDDLGGRRSRGQLISSSAKGKLLPDGVSTSIDQDAGAVESVSIDSHSRRGYFAVANDVVELDLDTLQPISRHTFSWPVSALSEAKPGIALTVGTTFDLHLFDSRLQHMPHTASESLQFDLNGLYTPVSHAAELINDPHSHCAKLSQPGPLSILHLPRSLNSDSIWVAGRFTHLLNYDRRYFPRLRGTIHSGARLSSMTALPYPHVPRHQNSSIPTSQTQGLRFAEGATLIAAGAYKGKGSLELYGLNQYDTFKTLFSDNVASLGRGTYTMTGTGLRGICTQNRQTASSSKLLSVANHGLKIAYSDGDANIKWVERDGFTPIREFRVTPAFPKSMYGTTELSHDVMQQDSLWTQSDANNNGDIVQKLIPTLDSPAMASTASPPPLHQDNLIVWTGDGRLGMLGFGKHCLWDEDQWDERIEIAAEQQAQLEEREHVARMRKALVWQADETRFMTGMGLPFTTSW